MEYAEKFKSYIEIIYHYCSNIWTHKIVTVGSSDIQIGNILLATFILILGLRYLKYSITKVKLYIRKKFHDDEEASYVLERAAGYGIIFIFAILILEISNIPISSLAFVGGAVALGVGLGAQNLINNFISSIIVAIEKPVKIGDTIEIEGVIGTVTSLGARCIIINTDDNLEVLVPTSKLLQNSFINWSLNNNLIKKRIEVKITPKILNTKPGASMLSCEKGKKILEKALINNEYIDPSLEPIVYLLNVSYDTFTYEISYWQDLSHKIPLQKVQNSLSFALIETLSKHPIKFAISHIMDAKHPLQQSEIEGNLAEGLF